MSDAAILVVTGFSGSGKTTLIEGLVAELGARGYRAAAIKHHRHPLSGSEAQRDSERLLRSGAVAVGTMGSESVTISWPSQTAPDLERLASLMGADLVLAEGFKSTRGPGIIVYGERAESVDELAPGRDVVAVVGDAVGREWPWPSYGRDDVRGIADRVEAWLRERSGGCRV